MSTSNSRRRRNEQVWRSLVRQWRSSGLSVREFCVRQQLSIPSFYAWRRTIAQRDAQTARFVPVEVVPDQEVERAQDHAASGLELVLGAGQRLRLDRGFDGPTLQRLLALLQEGQP